MFEAYLPYRQQSVLVPCNLLVKAGDMGVDAYVGIGGFYGRVLNAEMDGKPEMSVDPNQWGISWTIGFQLGKVKISGSRRYQLNPMFVEEGAPQAKIHAGQFTIGYYF